MATDAACCGGGGGGLEGGGGDLKLLSVRTLMRDEIDEADIDDDDVVEDVLASVAVVVLAFTAPLSKGLTRSCGSKLVTGLYLDSSKTLEAGLLLELTLPAVSVEVDEVSERASAAPSDVFGCGWAEITESPSPEDVEALVLPEANENCLPKNELPALVMPLTLMPATLPRPLSPPPLLPLIPPPIPLADSLAVLPRFLFANSYMSPNIPAKVFLRFFMVSSASSTTEVWVCGGRCWVLEAEDMLEACDV